MRQATLGLTAVFCLGLLLTIPAYGEEPTQNTDALQPANEIRQCVDTPQAATEEAPLADVLLWITQPNPDSLSSCTQEQAALCPTGCGCLIVNGNPCCIGLATHCALTC